MSKVKCFACGKLGHYVVQCPNKKGKKKGIADSTKVDEFASRFDIEFSLVASLASVSVTFYGVRFVNSGAYCHVTRVREHFMSLTEDDIDLEVVLGDNSKVRATGVGTISFQRELPPPLKATYILYVLGLKKNLISVSSIEDRGYEVVFRGEQGRIYPKDLVSSLLE